MYKKSLFGASLLVLASTGHAMSFNTPISKLNLPVMLSAEPPPPIKYFPPSTINVSAVRTCGDGDVARFATNHPNFEYLPAEVNEFDVIMGYWIVEDGGNVMPNQQNWFPIAYQKVPIATSNAGRTYVGNFLPINHADIDDNLNVMKLLKPELLNLYKLSRESFESSKTYRVFSAAFGCYQPDGAGDLIKKSDSSYNFAPSPVEVVHSLKAIKNEVDSYNLGSNPEDLKIKISLNSQANSNSLSLVGSPTPFKYDLSNTSGENLSGAAYDMFKKILAVPYPVDSADYNSIMSGLDFRADLASFLSMDKIAYCKDKMGLKSDKNSKSFDKFEPFPMNLSCKYLFQDNLLADKYAALFSPSAKPNEDGFKKAKKDLAKLFLTAAAFEAAQNYHQSNTTVSRAGCFPKANGQIFVERLNSFPLKFSKPTGSTIYKFQATGSVQHPEYLFAIRQYTSYYSNPILGIWGQVVDVLQVPLDANIVRSGQSMKLPPSGADPALDELKDESFSGSAINIDFMTRTVGGNCVGIPKC
jgi:hypothetical protein